MNTSRSVWSRTPVAMRVVAIVVAILGFVLLFLFENNLSHTHYRGDFIGSIAIAILAPGWLALAILYFGAGSRAMREEHLVWYKQWIMLQGISWLSLSFIWFVFLGILNNITPEAIGLAPGIALGTIMILTMCWSLILSSRGRNNSSS